MSVIKIPILFVGSKGESRLYSLFDSGANLSCINPDFIEKLETPVKLGRIRNIYIASEGHFIEVDSAVRLDFYLDDVLLSDEFLVVPGLSEEAIIGNSYGYRVNDFAAFFISQICHLPYVVDKRPQERDGEIDRLRASLD